MSVFQSIRDAAHEEAFELFSFFVYFSLPLITFLIVGAIIVALKRD